MNTAMLFVMFLVLFSGQLWAEARVSLGQTRDLIATLKSDRVRAMFPGVKNPVNLLASVQTEDGQAIEPATIRKNRQALFLPLSARPDGPAAAEFLRQERAVAKVQALKLELARTNEKIARLKLKLAAIEQELKIASANPGAAAQSAGLAAGAAEGFVLVVYKPVEIAGLEKQAGVGGEEIPLDLLILSLGAGLIYMATAKKLMTGRCGIAKFLRLWYG